MASPVPALCRNGPRCSYLARGNCSYRHPIMEERAIYRHQRMGERVRKEESRIEETVQNPFDFVFADSLLNVMVKVRGREHWLAREELLRRIQNSDVKACLNVLQEIAVNSMSLQFRQTNRNGHHSLFDFL